MTTLDRLKLMIAAWDAENGVYSWWPRVYGLPDRTTPGDVWVYAQQTAQPIEENQGNRAA